MTQSVMSSWSHVICCGTDIPHDKADKVKCTACKDMGTTFMQ